MKIEIVVFRPVTPCSVVVKYQRFGGPCCLHLHFNPEDEGSMVLRNVGIQPPHYMA